MSDLTGKNAILTGASRGIGVHIGRALAREGTNLVLVARSTDKLDQVSRDLTALGVRAVAVPADITCNASRADVVKQARAALGPIDILVSNAGIHSVGSFACQTEQDIELVIQTNLIAPLMLAQQLLPGMLRRQSGHLVFVSSLSGKVGVPYLATYAASKAALIAYNHALYAELEGTGVTCSVVCPGFVSKAGMFSVYGKRAPPLIGESPPDRVAQAVVRAIKQDKLETIVNPIPVRPILALCAFLPKAGIALFKRVGLTDQMRRFVGELESGPDAGC